MNEQPIRVAQVIGKWLGGGVESVVMNYYRNIDRSKIQFDFICDEDSTDIPYEEIEKLGGRVFLIPPYQKVFKYQKKLKELLEEQKYMIVHSHVNALSFFPLRAAKKAGIPVRIAHSHSTTSKNEIIKNIIKQVLKIFSKVYATDFFACTEWAGKWLFGNKISDSNKLFLLNNAIDMNRFSYDSVERNIRRNNLGIDNNTVVIGNIGRFVAQKNQKFLLDIVEKFKSENFECKLILIGQGPLEYSLKSIVKEKNIEDKVFFIEQCSDVEKWYSTFDVFILPSIYEGLGMVVVEAQSVGISCICSNDVPSVVKINENVHFLELNDDVSVWCNLIKELAKIRECDKNLIIKNFNEAGYNIKIEPQKLLDKYYNLVNNIKEK